MKVGWVRKRQIFRMKYDDLREGNENREGIRG